LNLAPEVLESLREGKLTPGHARALLPLDVGLQKAACEKIIASGLSVRQAEELARKLQQEKKASAVRERPEGFEQMESRLREIVGTRVAIQGDEHKGRIQLEYYSFEELQGLVDKLLNMEMQ